MTRKDFELIARVFNKNINDKTIQNKRYTGDQIVRAMACQMADVLKTTNPLFDKQRFLNACDVQPVQQISEHVVRV